MNYRDIKGRKWVGGIGSHRPSKAVVVEAIGVVEAPAATFGGERGVGAVASLAAACASGWRCRRRWCFLSLAAPLLKIGLGLGYR